MRALGLALLVFLLACATTLSPSNGSSQRRRGRTPRGQVPALVRCDASRECVVVPRTCCGQCGAAAPGDALAVNGAVYGERTGAGERLCEGGSGCPDCYREPLATLSATCTDHRCTLLDLETSPLSACRRDADCTTTFAGCCTCGSPGFVGVARGREQDYRVRICGREPTACPECVGRPNPGPATCVSGHCVAPASIGADD